jgi:hypothetical protein
VSQPFKIVLFRFYEELNDYLPESQKKRDIEVTLEVPRKIRSIIKTFGISLSEIDLVLVNGVSVDFQHVLVGGERVSVYPVFERLDIKDVTRLRDTTLRKNRFVIDPNLEALAEAMKKSGFDVFWSATISDEYIRSISIKEKRIILTKRKALARLPGVTHAILIYAEDETGQLQEVMDLLNIEKPV